MFLNPPIDKTKKFVLFACQHFRFVPQTCEPDLVTNYI